MSDLDLDALERLNEEFHTHPTEHSKQAFELALVRGADALIQRLREAEAQLAEIRSKWDYGDRVAGILLGR